MAQHDERHLTTEQLSAYLDKQLPTQEQQVCETHLQTCGRCQQELTGLRQTVALLRALPQPALPRSFSLPGGVSHLPRRPEPAAPPTARQSLWQQKVRSSLRAASTIAAVIGLLILLGGLLVSLPRGGGASMTSTGGSSSATTSNSAPSAQAPATPGSTAVVPKSTDKTRAATATGSVHAQAMATARAATSVPAPSPGAHESSQQQPAPLLPNLSTPLGMQEAGFTLFVLGIVGVLLTRRKPRGGRGDRQTP